MSELVAAGPPVDGPASQRTSAAPFPSALPAGGASARADALPGSARSVHRAILRHFTAAGGPPSADDLAGFAADAQVDLPETMALLADHDLVHAAADGHIEVSYPFSGRPTAHTVELPNGIRVFAMCALDSLGIPQMINADVTIESVDPETGRQVHIERRGSGWYWQPEAAVVLLAWTDMSCSRVSGLCGSTNFHTSAGSAERWLAGYPALTGAVLDHDSAVDLAARSFATLLG
jgi:alkylmercury lyase